MHAVLEWINQQLQVCSCGVYPSTLLLLLGTGTGMHYTKQALQQKLRHTTLP
jgi:hypothetical protein